MNTTETHSQQPYLVLGATGSVGSALCRRLIDRGSQVLAAGRSSELLNRLSSKLDCPTIRVAVEETGTIDEAVAATIDEFGHITGAVNCIGSVLLKPAHRISDDEWDETIMTNLTSSFALLRAAATRMRENGGSVVLVSSAAARIGLPNHEAIAAAKAGIEGLVRSAAASYAARCIRVNAVAPGLVKSTMTRHLWDSDAKLKASQAMHPLGRLGEPDEVAAMIEYILTPQCDWMTGQVIGLDGGLSSVVARERATRR